MHSDAPDECAGGEARVHIMTGALTADFSHENLSQLARSADITSVFVAGGQGVYSCEAYSPAGRRILFCGHGALAAAFRLFAEEEPERDELAFSSANRSWRARRSGSDEVTLCYRRPDISPIPAPGFAESCIGQPATAAAEVGSDSDYLILELADSDSVRQVKPNADAIGRATRRALIVTAIETDARANVSCVYRYFAPQYGDTEDTATGSAAVQLGAYWTSRIDATHITARQVSNRGAVVQLTCHDRVIELTARVGYGVT